MDYRPLGRTGVQVSPLCLGCMNFGWGAEEEDSIRMIHRAMDAGVNFLDTANVYARGTSETITGKALAMDGRRDRVVLATKVHGKMDDNDPNAWGNHRYHIVKQCEESLKRLQTDHIDLYQMHRPQPSIPIDETLRALDDLIRAGKVRNIGTSTFGAWQIVESLWVAKELGLNRFVCEQPPYNLVDRRIERELLPMAQTYGIGIIPWSPLAGGLLSGKYHRGEPLPVDSRYANTNAMQMRRLTERVYDVIEGLEPIAESKECSLAQLALAWTAAQPGVTSPIIGPRTMEQYDDNMGAMRIRLSEADLKAIDEVATPGEHVSPYYEADWGPHQYRN